MNAHVVATALLGMALGFSQAAQADAPLPVTTGQTIYVPSYSHIPHGNFDKRGKPDRMLLSTLLSIRNTDHERPMTLVSAKYYDTDGKLIREYAPKPVEIAPMATIQYMVENKDDTGGSGAKFLVVWKSASPISAPLVETVNAYFFGTQSMAFTATGRPINRE
jgi:hypothetical protein